GEEAEHRRPERGGREQGAGGAAARAGDEPQAEQLLDRLAADDERAGLGPAAHRETQGADRPPEPGEPARHVPQVLPRRSLLHRAPGAGDEGDAVASRPRSRDPGPGGVRRARPGRARPTDPNEGRRMPQTLPQSRLSATAWLAVALGALTLAVTHACVT